MKSLIEKPHVYIAGPYVREAVLLANVLAADPVGAFPFIPHLCHLWHTITPQEYEFWMNYDLAWLAKCDALVRLPGESKGADMEVAKAERLGIPVYFGREEFMRAWSAQSVSTSERCRLCGAMDRSSCGHFVGGGAL